MEKLIKLFTVKLKTRRTDLPIGRSKIPAQARGEHRRWATREVTVMKCGKFKGFHFKTPKTGRTHQLRVHLKAIGYPIVGDTLYALKMPKICSQFLAKHYTNYIKFSLNGKVCLCTLAKDLIATIDYLGGVLN